MVAPDETRSGKNGHYINAQAALISILQSMQICSPACEPKEPLNAQLDMILWKWAPPQFSITSTVRIRTASASPQTHPLHPLPIDFPFCFLLLSSPSAILRPLPLRTSRLTLSCRPSVLFHVFQLPSSASGLQYVTRHCVSSNCGTRRCTSASARAKRTLRPRWQGPQRVLRRKEWSGWVSGAQGLLLLVVGLLVLELERREAVGRCCRGVCDVD